MADYLSLKLKTHWGKIENIVGNYIIDIACSFQNKFAWV